MIGQQQLLNKINYLVCTNRFPRFSIIEGPAGSGRVTIAKEISKMLNINYVVREPKIADVREMIDLAYKTSEEIVFIMKDADTLSPQAKGALLKLTEEPPNRAYIIMCAEDTQRVSEALRSRAQVFKTDLYLPKEIYDYAKQYYTSQELTSDISQLIIDICYVPGDVDDIMSINALEMYAFTESVVENIFRTSLENAMKLSTKISLKAGAEGYPLQLFFRMFVYISFKLNTPACKRYADYILITNKYISMLSKSSLSKQGIFDKWLFEIRSV